MIPGSADREYVDALHALRQWTRDELDRVQAREGLDGGVPAVFTRVGVARGRVLSDRG